MKRAPLEAAALDVAAVAAAWVALVLVEPLVVVLLWGKEFSGAWEIAQARRVVAPIAIAGLAPASLVVVGWWRVAGRAREGSRLALVAIAGLGAVAAGVLAYGVSGGRHFASWGVRGSFVAVLAAGGAAVGAFVVPRVTGLARRPVLLVAVGLAAAALAWIGDVFVLPRLYPSFHEGMFVTVLVGAAVAGLAVRASWDGPRWVARWTGGLVALVVAACMARTPGASRALQRLSNLRIILVEHAPVLGRAVEAVEAVRPPEAVATGEVAAATARSEIARSLDWTGHDIVLISVDALRADHVSAYGYARSTTPNLDAIAREGTLFEAAYCPTPHTSYSVTSMMTGKYLRPLLALGLGEDSETWAQDLRRYGWRTAAFYPPAVFFIDEDRFPRFEETRLGFEYAKVEFADPALRERQVADYLDTAPAGVPLFLWVHFFEPHEPYVPHADHVFTAGRSPDEDLYDGEIATADEGIGRIVRLVAARRPGAAVVVTADHGEEFGEHGGRYHGTTVYEEQVRVPLVVAGPGVRRGARVPTVVQTIDLLPTALSALGIPRPARLRGRDLGPLLRGDEKALDDGFAFAETGDYSLVAEGRDRLVCQRRAAACALYRLDEDPAERRDRAGDEPARAAALRSALRSVERDHGRFEGAGTPVWPEALRRGLQGEADAALDVASLLDDADVTIRRKAAEVSFALHAESAAPALRRALAHDEDDEVRRWSALALARASGDPPPSQAEALLKDPGKAWRRRAAIALGERGDARACDELSSWWAEVLPPPGQGTAEGEPPRLTLELASVREMLAATTRARCRSVVPSLLAALVDVRARPYVADALGALGDDRARGPLKALLASEPYVTTRPHEALALVALGWRDWASPVRGGVPEMRAVLKAPATHVRVVALLSDPAAALDATADGTPLVSTGSGEPVRVFDVPPLAPVGPPATVSGPLRLLRLEMRASTGGIVAVWVAPTGRLD